MSLQSPSPSDFPTLLPWLFPWGFALYQLTSAKMFICELLYADSLPDCPWILVEDLWRSRRINHSVTVSQKGRAKPSSPNPEVTGSQVRGMQVNADCPSRHMTLGGRGGGGPGWGRPWLFLLAFHPVLPGIKGLWAQPRPPHHSSYAIPLALPSPFPEWR